MLKRPKTQWVKNATPETYLINTINPENSTKVLHSLK